VFLNPQGIAVDQSSGDVYAYDGGSGSIYKFNGAGEPADFTALSTNVIEGVGTAGLSAVSEIAVDSSSGPAKGDIYVANGGNHVSVYGADGDPVGDLTEEAGTPWGEACGVAVDPAGHVYVGLANGHVNRYSPTGNPVTDANYTSSLWGLNVIGESCDVAADSEENVYVDTWSHGPVTKYAASQLNTNETQAEGKLVDASGSTLAVDPSPTEGDVYVDEEHDIAPFKPSGAPLGPPFGGSGTGALSGSFGVAVNHTSGDVYADSGDGLVEIFSKSVVLEPSVDGESVAGVVATSATLQAQINPNGTDTTYYFQYGQDTSYGINLPSPPGIDAGAGESDQSITVQPQGLQPDTTYHYRVVAVNKYGTVAGPDHAFTTQVANPLAELPDGRAYEQVSPPNKDGADVLGISLNAYGLTQASEDGDAIAYHVKQAFAEPQASSAVNTYVARRGSGGWYTQDITTPNPTPPGTRLISNRAGEYEAFSADLSRALLYPRNPEPTPLSTEAPAGFVVPYLRDDLSGSYIPLITTKPGVPPEQFENRYLLEGASKDLSHVVFRALLGPGSPGSPAEPLLEWANGQLQTVSVLPDKERVEGDIPFCGSGERRCPLSAVDGSRVYWTDGTHLYVRDIDTQTTVQVDIDAPSDCGSHGGQFLIANADGSKAFFTCAEGVHAGDLYEHDLNAEQTTELARGAGIQGVVGASEDGSYVYFVATGALSGATKSTGGGEPIAGEDNLYLWHEGAGSPLVFIATLSGADSPDWAQPRNRPGLSARVAPHGRWLAFMSQASLTGYDNLDASSGEPDEEVFVYDADSGRLACASCDPSGGRPAGRLIPHALGSLVWEGQWLAASIPTWTAYAQSSSLYQSRFLSDSGRLFFNSTDALVAQDINGKQDVYEWEPSGVGSCEDTGGCVYLISKGTGSADSEFLDASESGNDVFFLTRDRLVAQDVDGNYDVYDARVCTTDEPCPAQPAAELPACASGDACRAAPTPQPQIFGPPASATLVGAGNPPRPPSVSTKRKTKSKKNHRAKKKPRRPRKGLGKAKKSSGRSASGVAKGRK